MKRSGIVFLFGLLFITWLGFWRALFCRLAAAFLNPIPSALKALETLFFSFSSLDHLCFPFLLLLLPASFLFAVHLLVAAETTVYVILHCLGLWYCLIQLAALAITAWCSFLHQCWFEWHCTSVFYSSMGWKQSCIQGKKMNFHCPWQRKWMKQWQQQPLIG